MLGNGAQEEGRVAWGCAFSHEDGYMIRLYVMTHDNRLYCTVCLAGNEIESFLI